jgi:SAM-dependent methyltransferase
LQPIALCYRAGLIAVNAVKTMSTKHALRPCPICGTDDVEILHHQRFVVPDGYILPAAFDVVWCPKCGFAYADSPARQEAYDRYYAAFSKYEDNQTSTGGGGSTWDARRLRDTASAIAAAVPDRQSRIIDIGCANGGLLSELKALGYSNLVGVDPSAGCVANIQRSHGVEAHVGSIRSMPAVGTFDLLILSHVLEHVADLRSTVRDLTGLLRLGGRCYIEVPDATRYRDFLLAPFQDFNTEHINHFSLAALENLFGSDGFTVESRGQKTIESSPGCPYPAAYIFFVLQGGKRDFQTDESLRRDLVEYIEASRRKLEKIDQRLAATVCAAGQPVLVWGTGQLTMKLLAETCLGSAAIVAFVDGNPINQGKTVVGRPVLAPRDVTDRSAPILLATLLHQDAIEETIRVQLGLPNEIVRLEEDDSLTKAAGLAVH